MNSMASEETPSPNQPLPKPKRWLIAAIIGVLCLLIVAAFLIFNRPSSTSSQAGREVPKVESIAGREVPKVDESNASTASTQQADLTLSREMIKRIGLSEEVVSTQAIANQLRTTGTVQPNAYRETRVVPLVGGRVTSVKAELGDYVKKGQPLAIVFSADLAEAQMEYRKVMADFDVFTVQHERAIKLAQIGAMSKQELEQAEAHYRQHHAEHEAAEQKLRLLGLTENQIQALNREDVPIRSEIAVVAPASGIITARNVNVGQVISNSETLFSVTDLSNVWVIANVYEKDFALLREGTSVTITAVAYPGKVFHGKVSYIDPRVDPQSRTAQARIEVTNPGQMLKLGMFVDVALSTSGTSSAIAIPRSALQTVGDHTVAFVSLGNGAFQMRRVEVGQDTGEFVQIINGISTGEKVVTTGSFFLRAEMARR